MEEEKHRSYGPMAGTLFLQARRTHQLHLLQRSSLIPISLPKLERDLICLIKHGYQPFQGMGKNEDGIIEPIIPVQHADSSGLGFTGQDSNQKDQYLSEETK